MSNDRYLPTHLSASCISALAAWLVWIFQAVWSWAVISAASTDHPSPKLWRSLWMTSVYIVLGRPCLCLPWADFQRCSLFGIFSLSILKRWPNKFNLQFLMIFDSWGCLEFLCAYLRHVGTKQSAGSYDGIVYQRHLI